MFETRLFNGTHRVFLRATRRRHRFSRPENNGGKTKKKNLKSQASRTRVSRVYETYTRPAVSDPRKFS